MEAVVDTSTLAEQSTKPSRSQQMVLDILIASHRAHQKDKTRVKELTAGEIRERLEAVHAPRRFDKGWVTGRLDELRSKGAVEQSEDLRFNPATKKSSHLWFIPAQQARLFC